MPMPDEPNRERPLAPADTAKAEPEGEREDTDIETLVYNARLRTVTLKSMRGLDELPEAAPTPPATVRVEMAAAADPDAPSEPLTAGEARTASEPPVPSRPHVLVTPLLPSEPPAAAAPLERFGARRSRSWLVIVAISILGAGAGYLLFAAVPQDTPAAKSVASALPHPARPSSSAPTAFALHLQVRLESNDAIVTLDRKRLGPNDYRDGQLTLPCPRGHHDLRIEAQGHRTVTKVIPCEGRVVLDVTLDKE